MMKCEFAASSWTKPWRCATATFIVVLLRLVIDKT